MCRHTCALRSRMARPVGPWPLCVIAPTDSQALEVTAVVAGVRSDAHGIVRLPVGKAEPGQPVAARTDEDPADLREKL